MLFGFVHCRSQDVGPLLADLGYGGAGTEQYLKLIQDSATVSSKHCQPIQCRIYDLLFLNNDDHQKETQPK